MKIGDKLTQEKFNTLDFNTQGPILSFVKKDGDTFTFKMITIEDLRVVEKEIVISNNFKDHYVWCRNEGGSKADCKRDVKREIIDIVREKRNAEIERLRELQILDYADEFDIEIINDDLN